MYPFCLVPLPLSSKLSLIEMLSISQHVINKFCAPIKISIKEKTVTCAYTHTEDYAAYKHEKIHRS